MKSQLRASGSGKRKASDKSHGFPSESWSADFGTGSSEGYSMLEWSEMVEEAGLEGWDLTMEFLRRTQRWREPVSRKLLLETDNWSFERAMPAREVANEAIGIMVG